MGITKFRKMQDDFDIRFMPQNISIEFESKGALRSPYPCLVLKQKQKRKKKKKRGGEREKRKQTKKNEKKKRRKRLL